MSKLTARVTVEYGQLWSPSEERPEVSAGYYIYCATSLPNLQSKIQGFSQVNVEKASLKAFLFVYFVTELCSCFSFNVLI